MQLAVDNNKNGGYVVHPKKFALWAACGSIVMIFLSLTSAYLVRKEGGNWAEFKFPPVFVYNVFVVIASSVLLQWGIAKGKKGHMTQFKTAVTLAVLLGFLFLFLQYRGWMFLNTIGVYMNGNPSHSFMFAITGMHAAHLLGGLIALFVGLIIALSTNKQQFNDKDILSIELLATYWHFVGGLWIYLVIFFNI